MGKKRVYDIAKELGLSSKDVLELLKTMGHELSSTSSSVDNDVADQLKAAIVGAAKKASAQKPAEPKTEAPKAPAAEKPAAAKPAAPAQKAEPAQPAPEKAPQGAAPEKPAEPVKKRVSVVFRSQNAGSNRGGRPGQGGYGRPGQGGYGRPGQGYGGQGQRPAQQGRPGQVNPGQANGRRLGIPQGARSVEEVEAEKRRRILQEKKEAEERAAAAAAKREAELEAARKAAEEAARKAEEEARAAERARAMAAGEVTRRLAETVNLRDPDDPDILYGIVPHGSYVTVLADLGDGWYLVDYDGVEGMIKGGYFTEEDP